MSGEPRREINRNGVTIRELAKRTGLSTSTIKRWTSEPRDDYLLRVHSRREAIRAMYVSGYSVQEIMEDEQVSRATVYRALEDLPEEFKPKKPVKKKPSVQNKIIKALA